MYGLSGIHLQKVEVTRNENLTDLHINIVYGFDQLEINGTYSLKGWAGWIELDSKGEKDFSIKMINATIGPELKMDLVNAGDYNARR